MVKEKLITTKAYPQLEKRIKEIMACWTESNATIESVLKLKDIFEKTLHFIETNRGDFIDPVIEITGSSCIQTVLEYLRYSTTHIYIIETLLSNKENRDSTINHKKYISLLFKQLSWPINGIFSYSNSLIFQEAIVKIDSKNMSRLVGSCSDIMMLVASLMYNYKPSEEATGDYTALCEQEYLRLMAKRCSNQLVYVQSFYKYLSEPIHKAQTILAIINSLTEGSEQLAHQNKKQIINFVTKTFRRLSERRIALEDISVEIRSGKIEELVKEQKDIWEEISPDMKNAIQGFWEESKAKKSDGKRLLIEKFCRKRNLDERTFRSEKDKVEKRKNRSGWADQ